MSSPRPPLLLGFTIPDKLAQRIFAIDSLPAVQTHNFAWSLTRALRHAYGEVRLLSACPVQNFPHMRQILFHAASFEDGAVRGHMIGFVNIIALKHVSRFVACLRSLPLLMRRWRVGDVYVHGVHSPFLLFAVLLRLTGRRVIPILTDPPGVALPSDGFATKLLKRLDVYFVRALVRRCSAVVALAPELARPYQDRMPTMVLPGILSSSWLDRLAAAREAHGSPIDAEPAPPARSRRVVLYAGGLSAAYGVDRLIAAAALTPDIDYCLYGKGDQVDVLSRTPRSNVHYRGFAGPDVLAAAMQEADVLINPRPSGAGFAVQSFPSKLIEYLATDRSVLTTRIRSIPDAIASCFAYIDDESPGGIAAAIEAILARGNPIDPDLRASRIVACHYGEHAVGQGLVGLIRSLR